MIGCWAVISSEVLLVSSIISYTMMMAKIVEHFITGLQQDCEQLRQQRDLSVFDSEARKKKEMKLYQQLLELLETERKYVQDLEQVCSDYTTLLRDSTGYATIDRKKTNKVKRKGSHIQMLLEDFKKSPDTERTSCEASQPSSGE